MNSKHNGQKNKDKETNKNPQNSRQKTISNRMQYMQKHVLELSCQWPMCI